MTGTDLSLLVKEMNKAKEVLMKIHELRGGAQIQHKESARRRVSRGNQEQHLPTLLIQYSD